jgi:hypothetical protein
MVADVSITARVDRNNGTPQPVLLPAPVLYELDLIRVSAGIQKAGPLVSRMRLPQSPMVYTPFIGPLRATRCLRASVARRTTIWVPPALRI